MALQSFKQWQMINEVFGTFPLGVATPNAVGGVVGSKTEELGLNDAEEVDGDEIEEGKCGKKRSKKMDGDVDLLKKGPPPSDEEPSDEVPSDDDEEEEDDDDDEGDEDAEVDDDDDDDEGDEGGEDAEAGGDITKKPLFMKKKMKKAMKKKMKKEDREWWSSVSNMLLADPNERFFDGFTRIKEDALIAPSDPNSQLTDQEPQPGEPGFAPQTRIGAM